MNYPIGKRVRNAFPSFVEHTLSYGKPIKCRVGTGARM